MRGSRDAVAGACLNWRMANKRGRDDTWNVFYVNKSQFSIRPTCRVLATFARCWVLETGSANNEREDGTDEGNNQLWINWATLNRKTRFLETIFETELRIGYYGVLSTHLGYFVSRCSMGVDS